MTKIANYDQKSFAGGIPPTDTLAIFGAFKSGYIPYNSYSSNIETLQSLLAWGDGLNSAMINYYNPALQDMNTLFHVPTRQMAYCKQAGIPEWKANITYYIGSLVSDGLGSIYRSLVDDNLNQPFTDNTKWLMVDSMIITNIGAAYNALNTDYTIRWSTADTPATESQRTIKLPNPSSSLQGRRFFIKNTSGTSNQLIIETTTFGAVFNGGLCSWIQLGVAGSADTSFVELICDGNYWWGLSKFIPGEY